VLNGYLVIWLLIEAMTAQKKVVERYEYTGVAIKFSLIFGIPVRFIARYGRVYSLPRP